MIRTPQRQNSVVAFLFTTDLTRYYIQKLNIEYLTSMLSLYYHFNKYSMTHKEIKKDIHNKLEAALVGLKALTGEKKFNNRIKKAAKLLAEGLGKEEKPEVIEIADDKKITPAKAPVKKAAVKKVVIKKTVIPVAKKAIKKPVAKKKLVTKGK
ncbi:MAG: hypothetical protein V4561_00075 [Bacteroidota bacterium]